MGNETPDRGSSETPPRPPTLTDLARICWRLKHPSRPLRTAEDCLLVCYGAENRVENVVQPLAKILTQKAQNEIPTLLKRGVFASIAPVGVGICQMLSAIQFNHEP